MGGTRRNLLYISRQLAAIIQVASVIEVPEVLCNKNVLCVKAIDFLNTVKVIIYICYSTFEASVLCEYIMLFYLNANYLYNSFLKAHLDKFCNKAIALTH